MTLPVVFLPHGGGPWPFMTHPLFDPREADALAAYLRALPAGVAEEPRALLVVSAHWEAKVPTVMSSAHPPMLFDYYGFPPETYRLSWPAPGDPALAARVRSLVEQAGFQSAEDPERGFDHGTFVPLMLSYPEAKLPTVQLSLMGDLDPAAHLRLGRALRPLRDEGVFIVGSGMSYHNMRGFGGRGTADSEVFDAWLREAATAEPAERDARLTQWEAAPRARAVHPREEHLLPLMVIAGAAGDDRGRLDFNGSFATVRVSAFRFG